MNRLCSRQWKSRRMDDHTHAYLKHIHTPHKLIEYGIQIVNRCTMCYNQSSQRQSQRLRSKSILFILINITFARTAHEHSTQNDISNKVSEVYAIHSFGFLRTLNLNLVNLCKLIVISKQRPLHGINGRPCGQIYVCKITINVLDDNENESNCHFRVRNK